MWYLLLFILWHTADACPGGLCSSVVGVVEDKLCNGGAWAFDKAELSNNPRSTTTFSYDHCATYCGYMIYNMGSYNYGDTIRHYVSNRKAGDSRGCFCYYTEFTTNNHCEISSNQAGGYEGWYDILYIDTVVGYVDYNDIGPGYCLPDTGTHKISEQTFEMCKTLCENSPDCSVFAWHKTNSCILDLDGTCEDSADVADTDWTRYKLITPSLPGIAIGSGTDREQCNTCDDNTQCASGLECKSPGDLSTNIDYTWAHKGECNTVDNGDTQISKTATTLQGCADACRGEDWGPGDIQKVKGFIFNSARAIGAGTKCFCESVHSHPNTECGALGADQEWDRYDFDVAWQADYHWAHNYECNSASNAAQQTAKTVTSRQGCADACRGETWGTNQHAKGFIYRSVEKGGPGCWCESVHSHPHTECGDLGENLDWTRYDFDVPYAFVHYGECTDGDAANQVHGCSGITACGFSIEQCASACKGLNTDNGRDNLGFAYRHDNGDCYCESQASHPHPECTPNDNKSWARYDFVNYSPVFEYQHEGRCQDALVCKVGEICTGIKADLHQNAYEGDSYPSENIGELLIGDQHPMLLIVDGEPSLIFGLKYSWAFKMVRTDMYGNMLQQGYLGSDSNPTTLTIDQLTLALWNSALAKHNLHPTTCESGMYCVQNPQTVKEIEVQQTSTLLTGSTDLEKATQCSRVCTGALIYTTAGVEAAKGFVVGGDSGTQCFCESDSSGDSSECADKVGADYASPTPTYHRAHNSHCPGTGTSASADPKKNSANTQTNGVSSSPGGFDQAIQDANTPSACAVACAGKTWEAPAGTTQEAKGFFFHDNGNANMKWCYCESLHSHPHEECGMTQSLADGVSDWTRYDFDDTFTTRYQVYSHAQDGSCTSADNANEEINVGKYPPDSNCDADDVCGVALCAKKCRGKTWTKGGKEQVAKGFMWYNAPSLVSYGTCYCESVHSAPHPDCAGKVSANDYDRYDFDGLWKRYDFVREGVYETRGFCHPHDGNDYVGSYAAYDGSSADKTQPASAPQEWLDANPGKTKEDLWVENCKVGCIAHTATATHFTFRSSDGYCWCMQTSAGAHFEHPCETGDVLFNIGVKKYTIWNGAAIPDVPGCDHTGVDVRGMGVCISPDAGDEDPGIPTCVNALALLEKDCSYSGAVCPSGKIYFNDECISESDLPCGGGKYASSDGTCTDCQAGRFSTTGGLSCEACPSGFESNDDHTACACGVGKYQTDGLQKTCQSCPSGFYQDQSGQISCETCSVGYIPNAEKTDCSYCAAEDTNFNVNWTTGCGPWATVDGCSCVCGGSGFTGDHCHECVEGKGWNATSQTCDACEHPFINNQVTHDAGCSHAYCPPGQGTTKDINTWTADNSSSNCVPCVGVTVSSGYYGQCADISCDGQTVPKSVIDHTLSTTNQTNCEECPSDKVKNGIQCVTPVCTGGYPKDNIDQTHAHDDARNCHTCGDHEPFNGITCIPITCSAGTELKLQDLPQFNALAVKGDLVAGVEGITLVVVNEEGHRVSVQPHEYKSILDLAWVGDKIAVVINDEWVRFYTVTNDPLTIQDSGMITGPFPGSVTHIDVDSDYIYLGKTYSEAGGYMGKKYSATLSSYTALAAFTYLPVYGGHVSAGGGSVAGCTEQRIQFHRDVTTKSFTVPGCSLVDVNQLGTHVAFKTTAGDVYIWNIEDDEPDSIDIESSALVWFYDILYIGNSDGVYSISAPYDQIPTEAYIPDVSVTHLDVVGENIVDLIITGESVRVKLSCHSCEGLTSNDGSGLFCKDVWCPSNSNIKETIDHALAFNDNDNCEPCSGLNSGSPCLPIECPDGYIVKPVDNTYDYDDIRNCEMCQSSQVVIDNVCQDIICPLGQKINRRVGTGYNPQDDRNCEVCPDFHVGDGKVCTAGFCNLRAFSDSFDQTIAYDDISNCGVTCSGSTIKDGSQCSPCVGETIPDATRDNCIPITCPIGYELDLTSNSVTYVSGELLDPLKNCADIDDCIGVSCAECVDLLNGYYCTSDIRMGDILEKFSRENVELCPEGFRFTWNSLESGKDLGAFECPPFVSYREKIEYDGTNVKSIMFDGTCSNSTFTRESACLEDVVFECSNQSFTSESTCLEERGVWTTECSLSPHALTDRSSCLSQSVNTWRLVLSIHGLLFYKCYDPQDNDLSISDRDECLSEKAVWTEECSIPGIDNEADCITPTNTWGDNSINTWTKLVNTVTYHGTKCEYNYEYISQDDESFYTAIGGGNAGLSNGTIYLYCPLKCSIDERCEVGQACVAGTCVDHDCTDNTQASGCLCYGKTCNKWCMDNGECVDIVGESVSNNIDAVISAYNAIE